MKVKIEKNLPLPPKDGRIKYPIDDMEVGDSFIYKGKSPGGAASMALRASQRLAPKKFQGTTLLGVHRVWRIA